MVFGMQSDDKPAWKRPLAITGAVAAGVGTIGTVWGLWRWTHPATQNGIAQDLRGRMDEVHTTDDANKLWEETYTSYINTTNPDDRVAAVRLFEVLYNHCHSTEGLKTEDDLATWQIHLESFKKAIEAAALQPNS